MRKMILLVGVGFVVSAAVTAAAPDETSPEARAYMGFSFGGEAEKAQDFNYGLRLDHDARYRDASQPAILQLNFNDQGAQARMNGLSLAPRQYRLNQAEEEVAEEGFFSSTWKGIKNFFGNLFGGDDEEEAVEETAGAAEEGTPAAEEPEAYGEGLFAGYQITDYVLLGVSAVGLAFLGNEVVSGDEGSATTGGGTTTGGATTGGGGTPLGFGTPISAPLGFDGRFGGGTTEQDIERQRWLDGGTGHMGDLEPAN